MGDRPSLSDVNRQIGDANRERVREWLITHVGGTNIECAKAIGMNHCTVGRHVKALRKEWTDE